MNIKITADSTCDLSPELIKKYDIRIIPLHIIKDDTEDFLDGVDINAQDIFNAVDNEGKVCRTAAVNIEEFEKAFIEELETHDAVIHIDISSEFSACCQNARIAAEMGNVYVIDSRNLSTGVGHVVINAAELAASGMEPAEIKALLDEKQKKLDVSFVINTLKYLHKGGRCSALAAFGANVLQLKPCIEVKEGKMGVGKKYRGSFDKVIRQYVKDRLEDKESLDLKRIFVTHSACSPELVADIKKLVAELADFEEIIETDAGCTVSSHCGPNCLGVLFYRK